MNHRLIGLLIAVVFCTATWGLIIYLVSRAAR